MATQLNVTRHNVTPRNEVITLFGYGIRVSVNRGHLIFEDGIGANRREARFPRVRHGLRRLVVVGSDGTVSLSALRWLADQDASFVMLDRDGTVLATTGPVPPSDARLRRAQSLAHISGVSLQIAHQLISEKLVGQENVVREYLNDDATADTIGRLRKEVKSSTTIASLRLKESRAAHAYWNAWRRIPVNFPNRDLRRVPDHWRNFGTRFSPLTSSPRLAVNPPNAMLNYLYAVLEAEARLAVSAVGLDPGIGIMHSDLSSRDSLACDVMEPIRPQVDAYVLQWIRRETLRKDWFFEQRDGTCRLMGEFASRLSECAPTWASAVAPVAEQVAQMLSSTIQKSTGSRQFPTRLTQGRRRQAKGIPTSNNATPAPLPESFCRECGVLIPRGRTRCSTCSIDRNRKGLIQGAKRGRVAAQEEQAQARRAETQRLHASARADWRPSELPEWLTEEVYLHEIQPRLRKITLSRLASALGISIPYASDVRKGRRTPHPRHWLTLARLINLGLPNKAET